MGLESIIPTLTNQTLGHLYLKHRQDATLGVIGASWKAICENYHQFWILPISAASLHLVFYLLTALGAWILAITPFMYRYKIQKNRVVTKADVWQCIKLVAFNQFLVEAPLYFVIPILSEFASIPYDWESRPTLTSYLWKIPVCLIMEDAYHYWMHRVLHHKSIYGLVHKIHHTYNSPFAMVAEYAHPIETIVLGIGFFVPLPFLCDHMFFMFVWLAIRMLETADVHSGYDISFNPLRLIPYYGGPNAHDMHHAKTTCNYSSSFIWWDLWFGTYQPPAPKEGADFRPKFVTASAVNRQSIKLDQSSNAPRNDSKDE